jgi:hypothetical protein
VATVYTDQLSLSKGLAGYHAVGGPAQGFRWVIRDVEFFIGNQVGTTDVFLYHDASNVCFFAGHANQEVQTWLQWTGHQVVNYPDKLGIQTNGGNADVSVCGYVLTLP